MYTYYSCVQMYRTMHSRVKCYHIFLLLRSLDFQSEIPRVVSYTTIQFAVLKQCFRNKKKINKNKRTGGEEQPCCYYYYFL